MSDFGAYLREFLDAMRDQPGIGGNCRVPAPPIPPMRPDRGTGHRVYRYTLRDGTVVSVETTSPDPYVRAAALRAVARSLDP